MLPGRLDKIGVYTTHTLPLCINTHLSRNSICDLIHFWSTLSASKQHGSYREVCLWTGPEPGWQVRHHSWFYPSMFPSQSFWCHRSADMFQFRILRSNESGTPMRSWVSVGKRIIIQPFDAISNVYFNFTFVKVKTLE